MLWKLFYSVIISNRKPVFRIWCILFQDTRIGMSVNGIRKHCRDEDVVSLAKILIKNWKRLLGSYGGMTYCLIRVLKCPNHLASDI